MCSLYKGNNLISGHQVLYSTTGQNTDGAMTQKVCTNTFADQSLSNIANTATKCIDGQWVYSTLQLASSVTWNSSHGVKSYSLANYLPNDGYDYEILLNGSADTGTTNNSFVNLFIGLYTGNDAHALQRLCASRTRTTNTNQSAGSGTLIIPSNNKKVVVYGSTSSNANGTYSLWVEAYRRIGTNA